MNNMPVFVFASDKLYWALQITLHLCRKYLEMPITVFGFTQPDFELPPSANFESMGRFSDYPANRWSDAVIGALERRRESHAVVMLEDYWLIRKVNGVAVRHLFEYAWDHPRIGRVDLVTDRLYASNLREVDHYEDLDIVECIPPAPYHMSTQASIWKLECLHDILKNGESAWEAEHNGTTRMIQQGWRVVGTRQCPMRYIIGVQQGRIALDGGYQVPPPKWKPDDLNEVTRMLEKMGKL